jgi:hypothetical protein
MKKENINDRQLYLENIYKTKNIKFTKLNIMGVTGSGKTQKAKQYMEDNNLKSLDVIEYKGGEIWYFTTKKGGE